MFYSEKSLRGACLESNPGPAVYMQACRSYALHELTNALSTIYICHLEAGFMVCQHIS